MNFSYKVFRNLTIDPSGQYIPSRDGYRPGAIMSGSPIAKGCVQPPTALVRQALEYVKAEVASKGVPLVDSDLVGIRQIDSSDVYRYFNYSSGQYRSGWEPSIFDPEYPTYDPSLIEAATWFSYTDFDNWRKSPAASDPKFVARMKAIERAVEIGRGVELSDISFWASAKIERTKVREFYSALDQFMGMWGGGGYTMSTLKPLPPE